MTHWLLALVGLTTGLRRGEMLGLMWRDIDFDRRRLTVARTLEETKLSGLILKAPKTARSARTLPLPPVAMEALRRHLVTLKEARLRAGPSYEDNDLVFPNTNGGLQSPRDVSKSFISMTKRAKLEKVGIHTLRHTHITELLRAGVNLKVVSERAGHSSVAFTLQRYGHVLPDMQQEAADATERLVGRLVGK